jgi:hypothetical protein
MDPDVIPRDKGWQVCRDDGTARMVLPRPSEHGWAVFSGVSTDLNRTPRLGYPGSWGALDHAIEWARIDGLDVS